MATPSTATLASSAGAEPGTRQFWRFGLVSCGVLLLWAVGSAYGLGVDSPLDYLLCRQLAAGSVWGLQALGWQAGVAAANPNLLLLNGQPTVVVGAACDGLVLYVLLVGFVLAYPGPGQRRLWFIPMGIAGLWLLNVIRIIALALNHRYSPETFEFDHHYAFSAVAYAALGGLWLLWTRQSAPAPAVAERPAAARGAAVAPPAAGSWLTTRAGVGLALLGVLVLVSVFQSNVVAALSRGWAAGLAAGPAWLHQVPGAVASDVPSSVSHLALPVGAAFFGLFLGLSLLSLRLLLPGRAWRLVWRCYAGIGLACLLLLALGRSGGGPGTYRLGRLLLDFLASLLPVAGLLVLLWRPKATAEAAASLAE
ncbi:exosortase X [Hymenobacter bucti]|uniref:Exosortase X n=1 Tax=Hymenobacter bucti TaxID=1844114 RepID=A0ABW4QY70_9BACT